MRQKCRVKSILHCVNGISNPVSNKVFIFVSCINVIVCFLLFLPVISSAKDLSALKHEVIKKLENAQHQYGAVKNRDVTRFIKRITCYVPILQNEHAFTGGI